MSAQIVETTNKDGVTVSVNLEGRRAYFDSVYKATEWLADMKELYDVERIEIFLRQIVLMARKEIKYESSYAL